MARIFVHLDAYGARLGNGGFKTLTQLADELARLGYETYVFDQRDRLKKNHFAWLSWLEPGRFGLASVQSIRPGDVVVSSWISALLERGRLVAGIRPEQIRYWDKGELFHVYLKGVKEFVFQHCPKIAINNGELEPYHRRLGYEGDILHLDNWLRPDLFRTAGRFWERHKQSGTIGYQMDRRRKGPYQYLVQRFGQNRVILCHGDQRTVAGKMQQADLFLAFDRLVDMGLFQGQTFGLSLFEAMACGCACVARRHAGVAFLESEIPLVDDLEEAGDVIERLCADAAEKRTVRFAGLETIKQRYRFDERREEVVRSWLK
jgi:hypothetical protein